MQREREREFPRDEVKGGVAILKNRETTEANEIVNESPKREKKGLITMMAVLYKWAWENEYTPERRIEAAVVSLSKKGDKVYPRN